MSKRGSLSEQVSYKLCFPIVVEKETISHFTVCKLKITGNYNIQDFYTESYEFSIRLTRLTGREYDFFMRKIQFTIHDETV